MLKVFRNKIFMSMLVLICAMFAISTGYGQQSSEQYIPIGQSPGISNKTSIIGKIIEVKRADQSLVVESNNGRKTVKVTASTRFWLDRSKNKQSSLVSSYSDCEVGRTIEIKFKGEGQTIADWIKIEST